MQTDSWKGIGLGVVIGLFVGIFLKGILFLLFLGVIAYVATAWYGQYKNYRTAAFWKNWLFYYCIIGSIVILVITIISII
ncbi:hypothetical protein [Ammoniphilus sp. YIM 78166]|uniref:hypothetical protein n=1 Tax=Ammoniphilus sp. YIM 78166 TaxID=1644106 RepID=UPI00106F3163|nr:hypothetical protein [Ammoniphilus sp. YIM 78166]